MLLKVTLFLSISLSFFDITHNFSIFCQHSQLAILREHVCLSKGYNFRFIGHDKVREIRMLYSTFPLGKILMYTFGIMMLWKCPSFSLEKNRSGIHTLLASVRVRYLRRSKEQRFITKLRLNYHVLVISRIFNRRKFIFHINQRIYYFLTSLNGYYD